MNVCSHVTPPPPPLSSMDAVVHAELHPHDMHDAELQPHNLHDAPDTTIMLPIFAAALIAIVVVSGRALYGCYQRYRLRKTSPPLLCWSAPRPPTESDSNMRRVESVTTCSSYACKSSQARRTHRRTASDPLAGMLTVCVAMGSHPDLHGA